MPKLAAFEDWTPPWGDDDEKLDPIKVKKLIYNLHKDKETLQERVASTETERDQAKTKAEELEQKDLSETERLRRENEKLKNAAPQVDDLAVARLEIALDAGLSKTQAARLVGKTRAELEADAEVLKSDLGIKPKAGKRGENDDDNDDDGDDDGASPFSRRPAPVRRRSGLERDSGGDDRYDPAKLIENLPRR